ncbi:hypothetical protein [Bacillus alkalicellulosilyticus]|uniref:hypothetical protein n=1 Tax=Alkalihalobacterium alkalicellulosilyticum TaxID=1912214 RepID=UPI000997386F|nr:hypothetical protein [Bacillus alkalicellulosilyticus]
MKKLLAIRPYNDIWLDCKYNNFVGMLINHNPSFKNIIFEMSVSYLKIQTKQKFSSTNVKKNLLEGGLFFPEVSYNLEHIQNLITVKEKQFTSTDYKKLHEYIKNFLHEDYYILLKVDRYFYPNGRDAGKFHMVHPVFIYGYNDYEQCYYAIEDCMHPGKLDYYKLPYSCVNESSTYFIYEKNQTIGVRTCKIKENLPKVSEPNYILYHARETTKNLLESKLFFNEQYDIYYQTGFSALDEFNKEFLDYINMLREINILALRFNSFQQLHGRNALIIKSILTEYKVDTSKGKEIYEDYQTLSKEWEMLKNRTQYMYKVKMKKGKCTNYKECQDRIGKIVSLEREANDKLRILLDSII